MRVSSISEARAFLAAGRLAVVGVSRDPRDFSRGLLRELLRRGIDAVPVNPLLQEAEGRPAFARVADVPGPVAGALVLVPAARAAEVVRDCLVARVRRVWFHRGGGAGSASPDAIALCAANGVAVIQGLCPYMALPDASFAHRLHGFFRASL